MKRAWKLHKEYNPTILSVELFPTRSRDAGIGRGPPHELFESLSFQDRRGASHAPSRPALLDLLLNDRPGLLIPRSFSEGMGSPVLPRARDYLDLDRVPDGWVSVSFRTS